MRGLIVSDKFIYSSLLNYKMDDFNGIISKYLDKTKKILNEKYVTIRSIKKNKKLYEFPAVYIIYSPKNKLLYIGKSGNFYSRIYRHVHSNGDSCLNVMIDYFSF